MRMIMIMIALNSAIRDFYNLLTELRTVSNTYAHVGREQSCGNHVQHIGRSSRVNCDSSAAKFDRDEIAFIVALFYWLKPLIDEGGTSQLVLGQLATETKQLILKEAGEG